MLTRVVVAALNSNGEPDFYFVKIRSTYEEYQDGEHYALAERKAIDEGYEPRISFDELDPAGKAILEHFVWDSASTYTV